MSYKDDLAFKLETYSGEQMVMLTYEALIENLERAIQSIEAGNMEILDQLLDHNREIIAHLNATLGKDNSEITDTTRQIYIYINRLMTQGRIKMDKGPLEESIKILMPLRDGWKELAEALQEKENQKDPSEKNKSGAYAGLTYGKKDINIITDSKDWDKG